MVCLLLPTTHGPVPFDGRTALFRSDNGPNRALLTWPVDQERTAPTAGCTLQTSTRGAHLGANMPFRWWAGVDMGSSKLSLVPTL